MAEIIASGTTTTSSAEFTLAEGATAMLSLAAPSAASVADVEIKTTAGAFVPVGSLDRSAAAQLLSGPGTFRVTRRATSEAFSVDKT